ncbi:MAG: type III pantothenate kinase [Oscillospiraceae bacterium]|nr:type III pantothenate kinase [Oscillospiraceae bacterium]
MRILAIDIGNSNIVIGCVKDHKVEFVERVSTQRNQTDLEYAICCHMVLELHKIDPKTLNGAIISSVVPPLTALLASAIRKLTGIESLIVGPGIKTGVNILMDQPAQVGSDLVVAAVAAIHEYGAPALVIDMGTATTLTVIDQHRNFIGGLILPGVQIALQSLESMTAQLPRIHLKAPAKAIGGNTIDAMQSGLVYGNAASIDGLIDRITEEVGYPLTVVASGGLAPLIIAQCRHDIIIDQELLLKGLDLLYYKNEKH